MALKHDGETYEYFICSSKFCSYISYAHEGRRPSKQKQTCAVCNATYSDSYLLKKHIESVHEGKTYQCSYYGEVLKTKGSLEGHIPMDHTKSFAKLFTVQSKLCGKTFQTISEVKNHVKVVHEGITYECQFCNKSYRSKITLKGHILAVHEGKKPSFPCSLCDKCFVTTAVLKRHIEAVHEKKRPFACDICN